MNNIDTQMPSQVPLSTSWRKINALREKITSILNQSPPLIESLLYELEAEVNRLHTKWNIFNSNLYLERNLEVEQNTFTREEIQRYFPTLIPLLDQLTQALSTDILSLPRIQEMLLNLILEHTHPSSNRGYFYCETIRDWKIIWEFFQEDSHSNFQNHYELSGKLSNLTAASFFHDANQLRETTVKDYGKLFRNLKHIRFEDSDFLETDPEILTELFKGFSHIESIDFDIKIISKMLNEPQQYHAVRKIICTSFWNVKKIWFISYGIPLQGSGDNFEGLKEFFKSFPNIRQINIQDLNIHNSDATPQSLSLLTAIFESFPNTKEAILNLWTIETLSHEKLEVFSHLWENIRALNLFCPHALENTHNTIQWLDYITPVFSKFKHLRYLQIWGSLLYGLDAHTLSLFWCFPNLRHLSLTWLTNYETPIKWLQAIPHIESLEIDGTLSDEWCHCLWEQIKNMPNLKSVNPRIYISPESVIDYLYASQHIPHIAIPNMPEWSLSNDFLQKISPYLPSHQSIKVDQDVGNILMKEFPELTHKIHISA